MTPNNNKALKKREARTVIVAELYAKGYSYRQIMEMVKERLQLTTYSLSTVKKDIDVLKAEWKDSRVADMDDAINHELYKISLQEQELWSAWEKSKADQTLTSNKQRGVAAQATAVGEKGLTTTDKIKTTNVEKVTKEEINYGDVRYQDLINRLGQERRKLLGMYAAEKKEITGKDGSPVFNGFDAFMANCLDLASNDQEQNEATQQEAANSAG